MSCCVDRPKAHMLTWMYNTPPEQIPLAYTLNRRFMDKLPH
jgi:hypothetical protein